MAYYVLQMLVPILYVLLMCFQNLCEAEYVVALFMLLAHHIKNLFALTFELLIVKGST